MNNEKMPHGDDPMQHVEQKIFNEAGERITKDEEYMTIISEIHSLKRSADVTSRVMLERVQNDEKPDVIASWKADIERSNREIERLEEKARALKKGSVVFDNNELGYSIAREALELLREVVKRWQVGGETAYRQLDEELSDGFRDSIIENEDTLNHMEVLAMDKLKEAMNQEIPHEFKTYILDAIVDYLKVGNDTKMMKEAEIIANKLAK
ncbi:MAG: hypothetical protein QG603_738 [Patescibacteria group bacterium]|nr:hypothetical protein [Patescibacteria group bacterium]MDQ5970961.1 hypothetical protein [Patescibacteria group bacterium]